MTKEQLRNKMKQLRSQLNPNEREAKCNMIQSLLFNTKSYRECDMIFTFISFGDEVDTLNIIEQAFLDHKRIFVPRIDQKNMEFYEITDMDSLIRSKYGILEPRNEESTRYLGAIEKYQSIDPKMDKGDRLVEIQAYDMKKKKHKPDLLEKKLMILPGLAFDHSGNRIGYGAGYYDKYLANHKSDHFHKVALAYDFQVLEQIPVEEFDEKSDVIITPDKIIQCRP